MSTNRYVFHLTLFLACVTCVTVTNVRTDDKNKGILEDDDDYVPYIDSGIKDDFDWLLLKYLNTAAYGNVVVSPISLKITLALLYEGAGGNTEQELKNLLKLNANKTIVHNEFGRILSGLLNTKKPGCNDNNALVKKDIKLNFGSRIFMDYRIQPTTTFQSKACEIYQTKIEAANFSNPLKTSMDINNWANKLSYGSVEKLVSEEEIKKSVLLLLNVIYFKGLWKHQFLKNQTYRGGFYLAPNKVAQVDYMAITDNYMFVESKELEAKLIRIPYQGKQFSMILVLPNSKAGLPPLIQRLNVATLKNVINMMDNQLVDLILPKFKFNFQVHLADILKNMGLVSLFADTVSLPGLSRGNDFKPEVTDIIQKTGIEVSEEGSIAFAATNVQIGNKFGSAQSEFNATHPFLFYIEDQITRTILFIGKVENPLDSPSIPVPTRFGHPQQSAIPISAPELEDSQVVYLNPVNTEAEQSLLKRFNYFDLELLREVANNDNVFISPASIKATLGMIMEGAQGACAAEIAKTLRLPLNASEQAMNQLKPLLYDLSENSANTILNSANGIFVSDKLSLQSKYEKIISEYYRGTVRSINYANVQKASDAINTWVANATKGLISNIVSPENLSPQSSIVITNAMYFRGVWKYAFEPMLTSVRCFELANGQCWQSYMMQNNVETNYKLIPEIDAHALELPYNDDKYAMLILLPQVKNNIHALIRDLQHESFGSIVDKMESTEVFFEIPRFQMEYSISLVHPLKQLNIREIFGDKANLSGIVNNQAVGIQNILHKTHIEVNESGTVAAAATSAVVIPLMGSSAARVICNHPFMFFIYKRENRNILFEGIVNKPTSATPGNLRNNLYNTFRRPVGQ